MEKIVHVARNHKEAEEYDIKQYIDMTPDERLTIAKVLKERVYGNNSPDVREGHKKK